MQIKPRSHPSAQTSLGDGPLARVLANRGIRSLAELDYNLKHLLPPNGLSHIDTAAEIFCEAIEAQARVLIVGDFDADGATSCALAIRCLRRFGLHSVDYLVPNRFEFGYGLSPEIVGVATSYQPDIILTVDNGVSSVAGVHAAQALGMMVVVTDHHLPGSELPTAEAIVNPNLSGDTFASKNLAGVGVTFYLMLAIRARLRKQGWFRNNGIEEPNMSQCLDLVALGTVADVVPLDRNNRILVQQGLSRVRQGLGCPGIQALLALGKRDAKSITSSDLGFVLGPRLNAAGRLDDMAVGIECLLAESIEQALPLAQQLDELNRERKSIESNMQDEALAMIDQINLDQSSLPPVVLLKDESWHQGVVGLVASRIKERVNRPVIAFAPSDTDGEWKGSGRSVSGVHLRDLLARVAAKHPNAIQKFGGHSMAAGLSVSSEQLVKFEELVMPIALEFTQGKDWEKVLWTDGSLNESEFTLSVAQELRTTVPWGQEFNEPVFEGEFRVVDQRTVGDYHLKLKLKPINTSLIIDAIMFNYFRSAESLASENVRCAYRLDVNDYNQQLTLQLILLALEPIFD